MAPILQQRRILTGERSYLRRALGYLTVIILVTVWQALWEAELINRTVIPSPVELANTFVALTLDGTLLDNILASLGRVAIGYLLAAAIGLPLGFCLGRIRILREALLPTVELIRPIPPLAWVPLAIVWFGIGNGPAYFIVFLAAVFPILINALDGASSIDKLYYRAAECLGFGPWRTFRLVTWPAALPQVLTGLRVAAGIAWMAVVGAEMIAARSGLGYMIYEGSVLLRTDFIVTGMITVGLLGAATAGLLSLFQSWVLQWRT
ncbi:MAG: ABC transporter permease [Hyphomicrobiaceae bacterium]